MEAICDLEALARLLYTQAHTVWGGLALKRHDWDALTVDEQKRWHDYAQAVNDFVIREG